MKREKKNLFDDDVTIIDLDSGEHLNIFALFRSKTSQSLYKHKKIAIFIASIVIILSITILALNISPMHALLLSKVSGIPLNAITVRVKGRDVYGQRKIDGIIIWHTTLDSISSKSPQILGNIVYILSENNVLYAFNEQNGSLIWHYHLGDFTTYQPMVSDQVMYMSSPEGVVKAFQVDDGMMLWKTPLPGKVSSPLMLEGNILYICIDYKTVIALRKTDGSLIWKFSSSYTITSSLIIQNNALYYMLFNTTLVALDKQKGTLLWKKQLTHVFQSTNKSDLIFSSNHLIFYVGSNVNANSVNGEDSITAVKSIDGSLAWYRQISEAVRSSAISAHSLYILTLNGLITRYDNNTGKEIWHVRLGNAYTSSMTVEDNNVYIYAIDGAYDVLSAKNGKLIRYGRTDFLILSPTIINSRVYVESQDFHEMYQGGKQYYSAIFAFDAETGTPIWHYLSLIPLSLPSVVNGRAYVADIQGNIYVLDAQKGTPIWHNQT